MYKAGLPTPLSPMPGQTDDLAAVVVRRLEKPSRGSWGLLKTVVLGVPTFGLLPLFVWSSRFWDYVVDESGALTELAEWSKARGRNPAAVGPLLAAADDTRFRPMPWVQSLIILIFLVGLLATTLRAAAFDFSTLLACTYLHWQAPHHLLYMSRHDVEFVYRAWTIALGLGYVFQWLQVRSHAADVRHFISRFNPIAQAEMLPPVLEPFNGWVYFRPLWIVTAVLLASYGAWWGIPMVLAGMAQRRYTRLTGPHLRRELARRVKDIVALRQMGVGRPGLYAVATARRCGNVRCLAPLNANARFCARCGSRA